MRLFQRDNRTSRPAAGSVWAGPRTYTTDPEIGRPGYYALEDDGRTLVDPPILLTCVNVHPEDEEDTEDLYIVANPEEPYHAQLPPHLNAGVVALEATVQGTSEVTPGG